VDDLLLRPMLDVLTSGAGSAPLARLLDVAAQISGAPACAILLQHHMDHFVIAARGFPALHRGASHPGSKAFNQIFDGPIEIGDAQKLSSIARSPGLHPWAWIASVPVPLPAIPYQVALVCADTRPGQVRGDDRMQRLTTLAAVAADEMVLASLIAAQSAQIETVLAEFAVKASERVGAEAVRPMTPPMVAALHAPPLLPPHNTNHAVVDFLDSTLITSVRLLHRNPVSYHATRRWRAPIKKWQLLAIKSLKQSRDPALIDLAAGELAGAAMRLFGPGAITGVAAVPCGNSGPDCFARLLGIAVAQRLQVESLHAFNDLAVCGASHPRRNAARPRMQLRQEPSGSILLIDDVATSGAHIAEATALLRSGATSVFPLVWLADA
jgi:hypothetical protein